jgi:hypothetical protein
VQGTESTSKRYSVEENCVATWVEKAWNFVPRGEQIGWREARTRRLALTTARLVPKQPLGRTVARHDPLDGGQQDHVQVDERVRQVLEQTVVGNPPAVSAPVKPRNPTMAAPGAKLLETDSFWLLPKVEEMVRR